MSTWIWILVLLIFGFVAFVQTDDQVATAPATTVTIAAPGAEWRSVTVGEVEGVIVASEDAPLFVDSLGLDLDENAFWRPSATQVATAEAALAEEAGALDHTRQYAGFMESGDRKIFINGFCDDHGIDWRQQPVLVDDGGDCYFTAISNVDTGEIERFRFNGES